jgi:hypothetical protein
MYYMKKTTVAPLSPRVVAIPSSELLIQQATIKQNMGLYKSPRVEMVEKFLQNYGEKRPIPVAVILPVILMNYGEVEFQEAQTWFEEGEAEFISKCEKLEKTRKGVTDVISRTPLSR